MKTTLCFCDRCGKQTNSQKNGDIKKNLYSFLISNDGKFSEFDKHGIGIELCGECAELFIASLEEFYSFSTQEKNIYKQQVKKEAVLRKQ